jgi:hypothetical protein
MTLFFVILNELYGEQELFSHWIVLSNGKRVQLKFVHSIMKILHGLSDESLRKFFSSERVNTFFVILNNLLSEEKSLQ